MHGAEDLLRVSIAKESSQQTKDHFRNLFIETNNFNQNHKRKTKQNVVGSWPPFRHFQDNLLYNNIQRFGDKISETPTWQQQRKRTETSATNESQRHLLETSTILKNELRPNYQANHSTTSSSFLNPYSFASNSRQQQRSGSIFSRRHNMIVGDQEPESAHSAPTELVTNHLQHHDTEQQPSPGITSPSSTDSSPLPDDQFEDYGVLITFCLQNDFIGKFPGSSGTNYSGSLDYDSSTFMHVGKPESQRLLGSDFKSGPLKHFMTWARRQSPKNLEILHIRFWNEIENDKCVRTPASESSPSQLKCNGIFAVKGTNGANMVLNLDKAIPSRENESYVNITNVNAFFGTDLEYKIESAISKRQQQLDQDNLNNNTNKKLNVKIGVIGVWSESTLQYLFYELFTRYRHFGQHLGTCSALTASRSRHQHFTSLQQLERFFSVSIYYSLCDFQEWLIPFWWKKTPSSSIINSGNFFFKTLMKSPSSANLYEQGSEPVTENVIDGLSDDEESDEEQRMMQCIHWKSLGEDVHIISDVDKEIICMLYHDSTDVVFTRLSGGFSGSWVFKVSSKDSMGHVQANSILKIGRRGPITRERVNFEKVEEILGNNAPQIRGFCELKDRAGIKFAYASMMEDDFQFLADNEFMSPKSPVSPFSRKAKKISTAPSSFRDLYVGGGSMTNIKSVLHRVFYGVLGRFYDAAVSEQIDLFETYDFDGKGWSWGSGGTDNPDAVRGRILKIFTELSDCSFFEPRQVPKTEVTGITETGLNGKLDTSSDTVTMPTIPGEEKYLVFPGGFRVKNIVHFLRDSIPKIKQGYLAKSFHYVSYVHGDLNGRNIILDKNENVWLIDFEYTERTHILKDVAKLENDILYEYTVLENEKELEEALLITKELMLCKDLAEPPPSVLPGLKSEKLKRAWDTVVELRNITKRLVRGDRNPVQLDIVLLRYALHIATVNNLNIYQRAWAMATACGLAQRIERKAFRNEKYHIDWINLKNLELEKPVVSEETLKKKKLGRLGISIIPGRPSHGGLMSNDLKVLQKNNVKKLVVLATQDELERLSGDLVAEATQMGIETRVLPVQQRHPPPMNYTLLLCEWVSEAIDKNGEDVVVVSVSGLGRSGTLASCILLYRQPLTIGPAKAMDAVKLVRGCRVIENRRQESFVQEFHKFLLHRMDRDSPSEDSPTHSHKIKAVTPLLLSPMKHNPMPEDLSMYSPGPLSSSYSTHAFSPFVNNIRDSQTFLKNVKSYDSLLHLSNKE